VVHARATKRDHERRAPVRATRRAPVRATRRAPVRATRRAPVRATKRRVTGRDLANPASHLRQGGPVVRTHRQ